MTTLDLKHLSIKELNIILNKIMNELSTRDDESDMSDKFIEEIFKLYDKEADLREDLEYLEQDRDDINEQIDDIIYELERLENKEDDLHYKFTVDELK